jgi:hypothetical protein
MDQLSPDFETSHIDADRRRRRRRLLVPTGKTERAAYLNEIAKRLNPSLDFFAISLLAGLVLGAAILFDNPAIYVLAALVSPFMAPVVALGFSTSVGSIRFFIQSLGSLLLGSSIVFFCGMVSGWISHLFVNLSTQQAVYHTRFSVPDFLLLTIGAALAIYLTVRVPKQRSLVASVALAYEIYLPIGVAGFGLTSKISGLFPQALKVAGVHLFWVLLIGAIVLIILKLRPFTFFGFLLTAALVGAGIYALVVTSALGSAVERQIEPFVTRTSKPTTQAPNTILLVTPTLAPIPMTEVVETPTLQQTPTNTLVPSPTPTVTITPKPTPVWAKVYSEKYSGVIVRKTPGLNGLQLTSLLNNSIVQVLADTQTVDNYIWAHVVLEDGREGWIVRNLLVTATPVPNW